MNVHWLLVVVIARTSDQSLCWLLPSCNLPSFHSLMGSVNMCTSCYMELGERWAIAAITIEVVGTCVMWGMDSRVDTLIGRSCLSQTRKLKPSLVYVLSRVCFAMICGCSYVRYWYSLGCGWIRGESCILVWAQARWTCFHGNCLSHGNFLPPRFGPLGDLVLLANCSLRNYAVDPPSMIDLECDSWIYVNHNHVKGG